MNEWMNEWMIEVAIRAVFEFQKSSHLQPLAATRPQVAAGGRSGRKWPQVAVRSATFLKLERKTGVPRIAFFASLPWNEILKLQRKAESNE